MRTAADTDRARRCLRSYLGPFRGSLVVIGLMESLAVGVLLLQAAALAALLDSVVRLPDTLPWPLLIAFPAILLLRALLEAGLRGRVRVLEQKVVTRVRADLFDALASLPEHRRVRRKRGDWVSLLDRSVPQFAGWHGRFLSRRIRLVLIVVFILIVLVPVNPFSALLLALSLPLLPLFLYLVGSRVGELAAEQHEALTRMGGFFDDRLRHLPLLRQFGAEVAAGDALGQVSEGYRQETMGVLRLAFLSSAILELFAALSVALVAVFVGLGLLGYVDFAGLGSLTLFQGLFILLLVPEFFAPLRQLGQQHHLRADALAAAEALAPWLEADPSANQPDGQSVPDDPVALVQADACRLTLADANSLDYPPLTVIRGERLCIAGPSGAGKSRWLAMLAGLEDDRPVRRRPGLRCLRVAQEPACLSGTLAHNLRLAAPGASDEMIGRVLRQVGLSHVPNRRLDARGAGLSGGERKRLALAQAVLSGAELWLLDEPTSALDPQAEREMLALLDRIQADHGITLVVASHSSAVRAWADRVLCLRECADDR